MGLPALATTADLAVLQGRALSGPEEEQAQLMLDLASGAVRSYLRQDISHATTTLTVLLQRADRRMPHSYGCGGQIRLPQRPVHEVASVKVAGVATHDWWWEGETLLLRSGLWLQPPAAHGPPQVEVVYTHGWDPVPADIRSVVLQAANRSMVNPSQVRSETVGGESVTYLIPTSGEALGPLLSKTEMRALDRYKRTAGTVRVQPL